MNHCLNVFYLIDTVFLNLLIMHSQFAKRGFFCLAVFLFMTPAFGQKVPGSIKGILIDSSKQEKIEGATVSVIEQRDSTHKYFTLSSVQGLFEIQNIPEGDYILTISYLGLGRISKPFSLNSNNVSIDFGTLKMQMQYKEMETVVIKEMTPVKINKDTIIYNADAFKTKENASVEDLLKKLPGVKVDKEGAVKAQGEAVQKIFIDGKEFFNNDTKMATQNLRADMIDQVQVYDDMSETAKFNHIDDGSRTKAINLKLKKDRRSGLFGKLSAGYGTNERYDGGFNINYFRGASQLSVTGRSNNTNAGVQPNSGLNNANSISSGIAPVRGLGSSSLLGINYRDTWNQYVDINAGYIF